MLRLARNFQKVIKPKQHLREDKLDLSNLKPEQFNQLKTVIAKVDGEGVSDSNDVPRRKRSTFAINKFWYDGIAPRVKAKDLDIQFATLKYPNYPGEPLPIWMNRHHEEEFSKRRQVRRIYRQEAVMQYVPFKRVLYTISKCTQGILPAPIVDAARNEFISASKGRALRKYTNNNIHESVRKNLYSSYKMTNPRFVVDKCIITGRKRGQVDMFRMHRMFFRKFADANQLAGVRRAYYGPKPNMCNNQNIKHWKKKLNVKFDDLPDYG